MAGNPPAAAAADETRPLLSVDDDEPYSSNATTIANTPKTTPPSTAQNGSSAEAAGPSSSPSSAFSPTLGTLDAFTLLVSIVLGSGIFTSPGSIDTNVPSPGAALLIWLVGGILAWTGASTMSELGTAIPGEGGLQPYLAYIYGDFWGFLAAWTWCVGVMPATLAILATVFVETGYTAAGAGAGAGAGAEGGSKEEWEKKGIAIAVLAVVSVANCVSTKASTRLNGFFVGTKFISIFCVVLAGIVAAVIQGTKDKEGQGEVGGGDWIQKPWFGTRPVVSPDGSRNDWIGLSQWEMLGFYSTALYGALWAYSGWDKAVYVSAELSQPSRQLPLAINTAIPTIIICFILANAAYYILLPWNVVSTTDSVAVTAITRLLGRPGGIVAAILICLVVAGSLLGNSFVAGRMAVSAANRGWFPSIFAEVGRIGTAASNDPKPDDEDDDDDVTVNEASEQPQQQQQQQQQEAKPKSDAPINAIILSTLLSAIYILIGNFRALLTFNGLGEYSFMFLTVLGALILRFREPGLRRPYKPFILIPLIFAIVSGFVVIRGAIFSPWLAVIIIALWVVGLVFYWARKRWCGGGC